jgi:fibronectin type 3 domain-containing protein
LIGCGDTASGDSSSPGDRITCTVTFDAGDGGGSPPSYITVYSGESITLPGMGNMSAPQGKAFNGWRTGGQNYSAWDNFTVTSQVTFVAQWITVSGGNSDDDGNGGTTTAPGKPTGVTATAQSSSSIKVSWNSVSGASSYDVYYEIGSSPSKNFAGNVTGTTYTHTGLQSGTGYYYYIKAKNSAGSSDYSSLGYAVTSASPGGGTTTPGKPTGVTATTQSSSSIKVSWNSVSGASSYDVYYEIGSSSSKNFAGNVTGTSYTHTGLQSGTTYYYYIKAKNSAGSSDYSSFGYAVTSASSGGGTTTPNAPTGVTATAQSSSSIRVSWNSVSGATSYKVYYKQSSSDYSTSGLSLYNSTTSTSMTVTGLSASRVYIFYVKAVNSAGDSPYNAVFAYAMTDSSGSGGGSGDSSQGRGSVRIVNNSSYSIQNLTMFTADFNWQNLSGMESLITTVSAGSQTTVSNVMPGTYIEIGSESYSGFKVRKYTSLTVSAGQTATLTITNSDITSSQ